MKPKLLLRIAAILMLVHAIGHTFGTIGWKKATEPEKITVISQMTDHKFPFMGSIHSMGEFYEGFGYACTIALVFISAALWLVAGSDSDLAKKLALLLGICLLFWGADEIIYFFPAAAAFTFISAILTLISYFNFKRETKA